MNAVRRRVFSIQNSQVRLWGCFYKVPFLHSESRIKISNLMITERFYSCIVTRNGGAFEKRALVSLMGL